MEAAVARRSRSPYPQSCREVPDCLGNLLGYPSAGAGVRVGRKWIKQNMHVHVAFETCWGEGREVGASEYCRAVALPLLLLGEGAPQVQCGPIGNPWGGTPLVVERKDLILIDSGHFVNVCVRVVARPSQTLSRTRRRLMRT